MTKDEIETELEALRRAMNSPKAGLYDMRHGYRRRAELWAMLDKLETETTKGSTTDGP